MEQKQYRHHGKEGALRGIKKRCVCQGHEIGSWNRQAKRACEESLLEGVPRATRVILQHTQQQRAEMAYWEANRMGKDLKQGEGERRVGREQNRTGHLKHELQLQVSSLFSHRHTTAESRSTCQCWTITCFVSHKRKEIRPKLQSLDNSFAQCPLKVTLMTSLKGTR